jgi:hypothetical protein
MSYGLSSTTSENLVLIAVDDGPTEPGDGDVKWLYASLPAHAGRTKYILICGG